MNLGITSVKYIFITFIKKLIPFLLLPIILNNLNPHEYGHWSIFQVLISFATPIIGLSLSFIIASDFYKYDKKKIAELISNLLLIILFNSILLFIIIAIIENYYLLDYKNYYWIYFIPIIACGNMFILLNQTILRFEGKLLKYGLFEVFQTLIQFSIAIILIVNLGLGWVSLPIGMLVSFILLGIMSLSNMFIYNYISFRINFKTIINSLKTCVPLLPHSIGYILITMSDRFFIDTMLEDGKSALGIYTVGYMFAMIVFVFVDSFSKGYSPWLLRNLHNLIIPKNNYRLMISMLVLPVIVYIVSSIYFYFFIPYNYFSAIKVIFIIGLGYSFYGMYLVLLPYYIHLKKSFILGSITFIATAFNLVGNYYLIKIYDGIIGAAISTMIAYFLMFILSFIVFKLYYINEFKDFKIFK